jgi:hypothetical protein
MPGSPLSYGNELERSCSTIGARENPFALPTGHVDEVPITDRPVVGNDFEISGAINVAGRGAGECLSGVLHATLDRKSEAARWQEHGTAGCSESGKIGNAHFDGLTALRLRTISGTRVKDIWAAAIESFSGPLRCLWVPHHSPWLPELL